MTSLTIGAGKGIHYWIFAQSPDALENTWGAKNVQAISDLVEVTLYLGFPRDKHKLADNFSKSCGHVTYEAQSESHSGSKKSSSSLLAGKTSEQSISLVRERLITPDMLMTMPGEEAIAVTASKEFPRQPIKLIHARYWKRSDCESHYDDNPLVLRKERSLND